jgi:hypothetical protein
LTTYWELKHLGGAPDKNDCLIFNGKSLDFLLGHDGAAAKTPLVRFFLTATNVTDECRRYSAFWGISIIEPDRLPLPLLYESVVRGGAAHLSEPDCRVIRNLLPRGFRPLQDAIADLAQRANRIRNRTMAPDWSIEVVDLQEQIGTEMFDYLDDLHVDWVDELADETWKEVGGW